MDDNYLRKNMKNSKCLGLITARGGSKGVVNKNIRKLNGIPLIGYTINVAKKCQHIDRLIVSTDSEEIKKVSLECGAEVPFLRPYELALDTSKQEDAVMHTLDWCKKNDYTPNHICLLEPTTPFRKLENLNRGFETLFSDKKIKGIFSITEASTSPLKCNEIRPDGFMKDWIPEKFKLANRQEMPKFFQLSPAVIISETIEFLKCKTFLHNNAKNIIIDPIEGFDIDNPLDFFLAQKLIENGFLDSIKLTNYINNIPHDNLS